jgi:DNA-binding response OmpR family regulator
MARATNDDPRATSAMGAAPVRRAPDFSRIAVVRARANAEGTVYDRLGVRPSDVATFVVGRQMIDELLRRRPAVVLVDHHPDDFDLHRICRDLRASVDARIMVFESAPTLSEPWIVGVIEAGADDVVPHTISTDLLHARITVALRTAPRVQRRLEQITIGDVRIDLDAHAVFVGGKLVSCPPRQFVLLMALANSADRVIPRDELLSTVWDTEPGTVDWRRLRIAVSVLRRVLGEGPLRPRVETVSHVGYRLVVPIVEEAGGRVAGA